MGAVRRPADEEVGVRLALDYVPPVPLRDIPQAWQTAEAYSFLLVLDDLLSAALSKVVFRALSSREITVRLAPNEKAFEGSEIHVAIRNPSRSTYPINEWLKEFVAAQLDSRTGRFPKYSLRALASRKSLLRSGILFGAPGAGKTTIPRLLAEYLGWPFIILTPGDFSAGLNGTLEIPRRATEIFEMLYELRDVVVLLDEMDELIADRESTYEVEAEQRLWTTTFLPKLEQLHDDAKIIYFVATNRIGHVDNAIARLGRFGFTAEVVGAAAENKINEFVEKAGSSEHQYGKAIGDLFEIFAECGCEARFIDGTCGRIPKGSDQEAKSPPLTCECLAKPSGDVDTKLQGIRFEYPADVPPESGLQEESPLDEESVVEATKNQTSPRSRAMKPSSILPREWVKWSSRGQVKFLWENIQRTLYVAKGLQDIGVLEANPDLSVTDGPIASVRKLLVDAAGDTIPEEPDGPQRWSQLPGLHWLIEQFPNPL